MRANPTEKIEFRRRRPLRDPSHLPLGTGGVVEFGKSRIGEDPGTRERRVLLCLTGMSPQIVTETVFALAVQNDPPWIPEEIHIITTSEGSKIARKELTDPGAGHLGSLIRDRHIPVGDSCMGKRSTRCCTENK